MIVCFEIFDSIGIMRKRNRRTDFYEGKFCEIHNSNIRYRGDCVDCLFLRQRRARYIYAVFYCISRILKIGSSTAGYDIEILGHAKNSVKKHHSELILDVSDGEVIWKSPGDNILESAVQVLLARHFDPLFNNGSRHSEWFQLTGDFSAEQLCLYLDELVVFYQGLNEQGPKPSWFCKLEVAA